MQPPSQTIDPCDAYTERRAGYLARGGTRHSRCKKLAVTTRARTETSIAWQAERTYQLCGTHAAMWDDGRMPRLRSDER